MLKLLEEHWVIISFVLGIVAFVNRTYNEHVALSKRIGVTESILIGQEAELKAHKIKCDELPKSLIIMKLDTIGDCADEMKKSMERNYIELGHRMETVRRDGKEGLADIKQTVETIRKETRENIITIHTRIDSLKIG